MIAVTVYQLNMCWCLKVNILMPFIINITNSAPQRAEEVITFSAALIKFYSTLFHPGNVSLLITPRTLICIYMYIILFLLVLLLFLMVYYYTQQACMYGAEHHQIVVRRAG